MKDSKPRTFLGGLFYTGGQTDILLLCSIIFTVGVGLICLWSASYAVALNQGMPSYGIALKQAGYAALGTVVMLALSHFDYKKLNTPTIVYAVLALSFILLLISLAGEGDKNGIKRWIYIGSFQFQPSEITKLALILFYSYVVDKYYIQLKKKRRGTRDVITGIKYSYIPFFIPLLASCALLYKQPHLSCMILITGITFTMMYVGGVRTKLLIAPIIAGGLTFGILAMTGYFKARMDLWLNPFSDPSGKGWQMIQSFYAIGSGGFLGVGLGNSRLKYMYLPEPENDFIFSVICEELGFLGALFIVVLFALIVFFGLRIAYQARDKFGAMIVFGTIMQIGMQALVNMCVVTGLFPNTGISLPFFSSGGTSLVVLMAQLGLVLSVARKSNMKKLG
ncbi:MAG: cell division protein FtsW [Clostridia bacterium]|nr:cell division protein FtsW [Clostridia bacterium]